MKPKKLVMSAFGSYGGVETIDFDSVNHGLFLIAGDTGAGKSTIFDAIMFALYDTMSGKERKGHMMRSEFAKDEAETFVEFTFSYGTASEAKAYTVKRYPSYMRKAKRKNKQGEYGYTKQPARVSLIMPDGKEYVGKVLQVNQKIQEIIGLTAEQFSKIAMIAQGEFQELIMDKTGRRKEIFQQIFSTEIYEKIERKILEQFKKSHVAMKENITQLREVVKNASFDEEEEQAKWKEVLEYIETEPERIESFLEESISRIHITVKARETELKALEKKLAKENQRYQAVISINEDIDEYEKELLMQEKLLSQKPDIQALQEKNTLAQKAKEISEYEKNYTRCCNDLEEAQNKQKKQKESEKILKKNWEEALLLKDKIQKEYQEKQPKIIKRQNQITEELSVFSALLECKELLEEEEKSYTDEMQDLQILKKQNVQYEKSLVEINGWLEAHSDLELSIEKIKQKELQAVERKERLEVFEEYNNEYEQKQEELHQTEKELVKTVQEWEHSRREYEEINHAYIVAQSAFLAMELEAGSPCPVCGSLVHPRPAMQTEGDITKTSLDAAKAKEQKCQKEKEERQLTVESQRTIVQKMVQDIQSEAERLFGETAKDSLTGLLQDAYQSNQKEMDELTQKLSDLQKLQMESEKKKKERTEIEVRIQRNNKSLQEKTELLQQYAVKKGNLETQKELLEEKITITSDKEGKEELENLKRELELFGTEVAKAEENEVQCKKAYDTLVGNLEENQKHLEKLIKDEKELKELFEQKLKENCFDKEAYFIAIDLLDGQKERDERIQEYQTQKVQNDTRIKTLKERIKDGKKVSVADMSEQIANLQTQKQEKEEAYQILSYEYRTNSSVLNRIKQLLSNQGVLLKDKRIIASLNDVANGKVHFQTYVQRQYFKKIIHAANQRLQRMTSNCFLLKCRELDKTGQGESGLDLDVYNPVTGKSRDAHTLSGGETFLASLSMALGMADVVQNTVGKTHLDTMFIDEGFGSLSEEVRNTAVRVLIELAGDSRLVGVISHVSELKEQIPNKLIVTKGNYGSKVNWRKD